MTRQTGWIGAEAEGPQMPVTALLLAGGRGQERQPGAVLEQSLARAAAADAREAREAAATAPDPDERASGFVARGYLPGQISQLTQRLGDTLAELADEESKIEKAARRQERISRDHAAGRITAFDIVRMMGDADDGDEDRVRVLERRAGNLRRQIAEASALMAPPQERQLDGVAEAGRHAHRVFTEITRAKMAEAAAGRQARPPFGSASRGAAAGGEPPACAACAAIGATEAESFMIHHCDADGNPLAVPEAELAESGGQEAGRYQPVAYR